MENVFYILVGALAVGIGVVASAVADRIRCGPQRLIGAQKQPVPVPQPPVLPIQREPSRKRTANQVEPTTKLRADAVLALTTMGFRSGEACTAVDEARAKLATNASLEVLIREALKLTTKKVAA